MSDYSLNEVAYKAKLAAKGAGYSWGMAEEVSRSVFWLVSRGLPAPQMLVQLLNAIPTPNQLTDFSPQLMPNRVQAANDVACPIATGCVIADTYATLGENTTLVIANVLSPVLLLPFIADVALRGKHTLSLNFNDEYVVTDGCSVSTSATGFYSHSNAALIECRLFNSSDTPLDILAEPHNRVVMSETDWSALDFLAQKTYAPSTEESRALGAGAGLSDND